MNTKDIIKKYDFKTQKKYGQNFLIDQNILERIVDVSQVTKEDIILEIGPGTGSLTRLLCKRAKKVIAVEIDRMLVCILEEELKEFDNFYLINNDILKTDIPALIEAASNNNSSDFKRQYESENFNISKDKSFTDNKKEALKNLRIKVVANLPYYITTPIVMELLERYDIFKSITVMVQKEVAERMREGVGTKSYGALSLAVQYYSRPEIVLNVSKNCFFPKPDVDSAVIHLNIFLPDERPVKVSAKDTMFKIIRAAFNQRRKTLINALSNAGDIAFSKDVIAGALNRLDKSDNIRGEALTLEEFARLTDFLTNP